MSKCMDVRQSYRMRHDVLHEPLIGRRGVTTSQAAEKLCFFVISRSCEGFSVRVRTAGSGVSPAEPALSLPNGERLRIYPRHGPINANLFRMFFVELPQNRHPERSASQIDCVTQRLWRGVEEPVPRVAEGTSAVLILPMLFGAFRPPKPDRKSGVAR
jgi:hypothetical protein